MLEACPFVVIGGCWFPDEEDIIDLSSVELDIVFVFWEEDGSFEVSKV